jgi:hypothetical protein
MRDWEYGNLKYGNLKYGGLFFGDLFFGDLFSASKRVDTSPTNGPYETSSGTVN